MIQYREIFTYIDCAKGSLISADGTRINRDEYLPRLILADEAILFVQFVNIVENDGVTAIEPQEINANIALRIIGDADQDINTNVMFAANCIKEKSDFANGIAAFLINSNTVRFAETLQNIKSKKCEFVILANFADPVCTTVLAKDHFIAENRPCETNNFIEPLPDEIISKEELQILLELKSPLSHTHSASDITDLDLQTNTVYNAGSGIDIDTESNTISADTQFLALKDHAHDGYASDIHTHILADITDWNGSNSGGGGGAVYTNGTGLNLNGTEFSVDTEVIASREYVDGLVGNISSVLDTINGEEV